MTGFIGADTVLKLGAQTPVQSAGKNFLSVPPKFALCPQFRGHSGAYHSGKTDIAKITRVKNKALLTWRLADIHDVSQNTPPEI